MELLEQGEAPAVVARILGVKATSLHRWRRMTRQDQGRAAKPVPGARRRLDALRRLELEQPLYFRITLLGRQREASQITRAVGLAMP